MRLILLLTCVIQLINIPFSKGQIVLVPIQKQTNSKLANSARTKGITPISLPFWDDFSTVRNGYVDATKWEVGNSVWVNDGMGINPPSINVATFDGLDDQGKPYNVNDVLAKGFADELISAPIRMDLVALADRPRIFLSFHYQYYGNGEPPDIGDKIMLSFKNANGVWEEIWVKENDGTLLKDQFEQVLISITDDRFFYDNFQFKFQNFARLSGPYDTWHIDYVYINNGKLQSAPVYQLMPDRTITSKLSSTWTNYWAMPIKHFFSDPAANTVNPSITLTNLRTDQVTGNGQPISYSSSAQITINKTNQAPVIAQIPLDVNTSIGSALDYNQQRTIQLATLPDYSLLDATADSIKIKLSILFDTGDNKIKTPTDGDYDLNVFTPIEFRSNDSISTSYVLANYYAYDDGTAEYGAGLNQPGTQIAYQFDMQTNQPDTIVAVDLYFPKFGDESNQVIQFRIYKALSDIPSDIIYEASLPIQRNAKNVFWRVPLIDKPAAVQTKFYIGWKQNSSATIAVGLDKNTNSRDKIFSNINGTWEQNTTVNGSLMIRPVFGKGNGKGAISGVDKTGENIFVYPNPSNGSFTISGIFEHVELINASGRKMDIETETENDETKVSLLHAEAGLYLVRIFHSNRWITKKLLIK